MDWQTMVALGCVAGATWSLGRRAAGLFRRPGAGSAQTGCGSCGNCANAPAGDAARVEAAGNFVPLEVLGRKAQ